MNSQIILEARWHSQRCYRLCSFYV